MPLNEKALIERIRQRVGGGKFSALRRGIGDDCAVLQPPRGHELLVTTDFCIENVHFRREWHPARSVGHRCLARGLSDIAAMGGDPLALFLSLAMPGDLPQRWVDGFFDGLLALARQWRVPLAGGDISQSPSVILADIMVLGSIAKGKAILRSTARPGDLLYVTGTLGPGLEGLNQLRRNKKPTGLIARRHFYPEPRIEVGRYLRGHGLASAMMDLSDGVSSDLSRLCEESGVGAVVYAHSLPRLKVANALELALHGGDDYELLFTAPAKSRVPKTIASVSITAIGEVLPHRGVWLASRNGKRSLLKSAGWEHFRS